jgi:5-methylthioadenosine/S-adenosylhomocysteine deaminase
MSELLIAADWVLPVASPPIRNGSVLVSGERIAALGTLTDLHQRHPLAKIEHFDGCTIAPGLVNAHTHLTLTALSGVVPPQPFAEWLPRLVAALKPWEVADHEASGIVGAEECLLSGVTAVGDIAYGAAEVARASAAGLGGVYYWELLGMKPDEIDSALKHVRYPEAADAYGERVICGLSPHSPYTSGPALIAAVHEKASQLGVPVAIHVSESRAEVELLCKGTGPLAVTAARTAAGFTPPGTSTTAYLKSLGALAGATAIHVCHLDDGDIDLLAGEARGVVTCPRSNRYLDNPPPHVASLLQAGIAVGIGTDSSASNADLDLMAEVRALASAEPSLTPAQLLAIATTGGAEAIGVKDRFGTLAEGRFADLSVFSVDGGEDPEVALIESAGRATVRNVMCSGRWRVVGGQLLESDRNAWSRAKNARLRSEAALGPTQRSVNGRR